MAGNRTVRRRLVVRGAAYGAQGTSVFFRHPLPLLHAGIGPRWEGCRDGEWKHQLSVPKGTQPGER